MQYEVKSGRFARILKFVHKIEYCLHIKKRAGINLGTYNTETYIPKQGDNAGRMPEFIGSAHNAEHTADVFRARYNSLERPQRNKGHLIRTILIVAGLILGLVIALFAIGWVYSAISQHLINLEEIGNVTVELANASVS